MVRARDPKVQFHSTKKPDLNILIHAVDILIQKNSHRLARELLDYVVEESLGTEVEFRLYLAVLFHRLDETLEKFKLLASIFKEHPQYVSNTTLELFYPLRRFEIMQKYKDKLDPLLAAAIIRQESAFKEYARSRVGAMGLMQLMPTTARRMEQVSRRELYDPHTNIRLGMKFYSKMVEKFGGDGELALAAYNAGPDRIESWKRRYPTPNRTLFMDLIPYKETREYVATIGRNYFWYLTLYEAKMNPSSSLRTPASVLGAPIHLKREFNKHRPDFSFFKP
jgi:soluble lytic murein transglycosylase